MIRNRMVVHFNLLCTMILILLVATTFSSGCIRMLQKSTDSAGAGNSSALPEVTPGSLQQAPVVEMTPAKSEVVTEVAPFLTPDPYPIIHGTRINATPLDSPLDRNSEFEKTYTLGGNAFGLLVNVAEGPLYIVYVVTPKYDCMKSPDSCRGNLAASVNRPYMTITVRDNQTQEIVAEDGYGRKYSSDTGDYQISITSTDPVTGVTTTSTTTPGPRYIEIYKEGAYQVTIEGNYLDVDVKILTGASPSKLDIGNGDSSAPNSQAETSSGNPWNQ
ncbi:hypothetical protein [Methanoregula sp.]|uniref:hypothetical protein n=1 Tax=Methanoregula sp. TaxID=2052170 RepID=UPI003C7605F4